MKADTLREWNYWCARLEIAKAGYESTKEPGLEKEHAKFKKRMKYAQRKCTFLERAIARESGE